MRCMLLAPLRPEFDGLRRAIKAAARESNVHLVAVEDPLPGGIAETVFSEVVRSDLVIAVVSHSSSNVFYEVGLAHATGKPVIFLVDEEAGTPFFAARFTQNLIYNLTAKGIERLESRLHKLFEDFRRDPRRFRFFPRLPARQAILPVVDLSRIEPREFENLCFELLTQMGFRRVEWGKEMREIDVVATLPKKDPDGFEYNELWFISMGLHAPSEMFLEMAMSDPDFFMHRFFRPNFLERFKTYARPDTPITLLIISFRDSPQSEMLQKELRRMEQRSAERRAPYTLRVRVWDRQQLVSLIQQYPQIAYKYFSEEGRAQSKYRKTPDELNQENVDLNEKLQVSVVALKEERDKRVRAERDAVWKDVAFTAAHKLGNPIFALETNLNGIKRVITDPSVMEIAAEMGISIEKAKIIIEQFKSLTKAQQISARPVDLVPLISSASRVAADNGVQFQIKINKKHPEVLADPTRMTECFDELFANALHWLNKPQKRIEVTVDIAKKKELPSNLDETKKYVKVGFEDNGCGIAVEKKEQIFAPFYTTYPHGTGLGLSLVQRVIEGHGGAIREIGKPGEGANFEIFIPQATSKEDES